MFLSAMVAEKQNCRFFLAKNSTDKLRTAAASSQNSRCHLLVFTYLAYQIAFFDA